MTYSFCPTAHIAVIRLKNAFESVHSLLFPNLIVHEAYWIVDSLFYHVKESVAKTANLIHQ